MRIPRLQFSITLMVLAVLSGASAMAQESAPLWEPSSEQITAAVNEARTHWHKFTGPKTIGPLSHECNTSGTPISCPSTRSDSITTHSCLSQGFYIDFFSFSGTSGQTVTISATSSWDNALALLNPNGEIFASNDDRTPTNTDALITSTLNATGTWRIAVTSPYTNTTGSYSLTVSCSGSPSTGCTPSSTNLCLAGNRFKVETRYRTSNGTNGAGQAVSLTGDTGYFWFFNNANVEMVIKVLNACSFSSPRYWVFAGGLTDVEVDVTVTDTLRGNVKTYRNNLGTAFQPIQDTNAFATCP